MFIRSLVIFVFLLFTLGCGKDGPGSMETVYFRSYVSEYVKCTHLSMRRYTDNDYRLFATGSPSYYPQSEEYERLCVKHDDLSFNRKVKKPKSGMTQFVASDFVALDIVSDSDFDEDHPAGSSLGDIIMFRGLSPIKFIRSGYIDTYDWKKSPLHEEFRGYFTALIESYKVINRNYVHPVKSLVSELRAEDMVLLGEGDTNRGIGSLSFIKEPTLSKRHPITVTITADDGQEFTAKLTVFFD